MPMQAVKKIALDLDGVVYNYSSTACFLLNHHRGTNLNWEETNSWNWLQNQVSKQDWDWLWDNGVEKGLFRYGHLIKGAREGVEELAKLGKLIVVTSRPPRAVQDTLDWLAFMRFPIEGLHIVDSKADKSDVEAFDLAIDDKSENVLKYLAKQIPTIVYGQKYNEELQTGLVYDKEPTRTRFWNYDNLHRADDWGQVVAQATRILNG